MDVDDPREFDQSSVCSSENLGVSHDCNTRGVSAKHDMPSWCTDVKYNRYWQHRRQVEQWFNHHTRVQSGQRNHTWSQSSSRSHPASENNTSLAQHYYSSMIYWQQRYYDLLAQAQQPPNSFRHGQYRSGSNSIFTNNLSRTSSNIGVRTRDHPSSCSSTEPKSTSGKQRGKRVKKKTKGHSTAKVKQVKRDADVRQHSSDLIFDVDTKLLQGSQDDEVVECHMQITDEMLEFFAQSAIHRKERDEKKKEQDERVNATENVFVDISKADKDKATTLAPTVRPGQKRTAEMKELYGNGAAMIHGMETAMQLNFDRNLDLKQPKHWPHLPLNILFK